MYIVSACLVGVCCRYDGKANTNETLKALFDAGNAMAVCPEVLSQLPIPRTCCEQKCDENGIKRIVGFNGQDYTKEFIIGAEKTLEIAKVVDAKVAILKSKSPSCGVNTIYDGSFSKKLISGNGFTAELLIKNGIKVISENDLDTLSLDI